VLDHSAAELENIVNAGPRRASGAFHALSRFASSLAEHLLNEAHLVAHPGRVGANDNSPAAAFQNELEDLQADWNEYLLEWSEASAQEDWPGFSKHSLAILHRVRSRIRRENDLILRRQEPL
jgi:hypothetical protein